MRKLSALVALFVSTAALAQISASAPIPKNNLVTLAGTIASRSGDEIRGTVNATIESGWHINSNKPLDEFVIPTVLSFDPATAELVKADYPQHTVRNFTFSGDQKLAVYEGTIAIPFIAKLKNNAATINASLRYQACNDSVCLPPTKADATIDVAGGASASAPPPAPTTTSAGSGFTPLSNAPKSKPNLFSSNVEGTFAAYGLGLTLVAIFVLGLGLNLTPCVYPVIPITIGFFTQQSSGRRGYRTLLSFVYVAGLVATYATLGVFSALSGRLFGAWLQRPGVLIFFAATMLVLASSMFGLWEIRVPHFIADRSGGRAGLGGALIMGLLVGIVAAPCVGPFVVSLLTLVAQLHSIKLGFLMFSVLGLGLGTPYLLLGIFSSAAASMPRAGAWMEQVKKAMGFVLIAMAFYFLRSLIGETAFRYGVAASLLIGAAFLIFQKAVGPTGGRVMRVACAILLFVAGVAFAMPRRAGGHVTWTPYDTNVIKASTGKPVIIDFAADWCIPCKELDDQTFTDTAVAGELARFTRVKANLTNDQDPEVQRLTKEYAIAGVPTIVFIDSTGHELPALRLTGFEGPKPFLFRLQQVK